MGIPTPDSSVNRERVTNPTASTPATFDMNWEFSENGPADPQPVNGVSTFMGPATSYLAGKGRAWPDNSAFCVKDALDIMRRNGYRCELPPEDWVSDDEGEVGTPELRYLKEQYYNDHEVIAKNGNEIVFVVTTFGDWIYIRCNNEEASSFVLTQLSDHYKLGQVRHEQVEEECYGSVSVTRRTGNGTRRGGEAQCSSPSSIGTLFELKIRNKVVAKALCSYKNMEMDATGPTIELLETAKKWRQHGYAKLLLEKMESSFEDIFEGVSDFDEDRRVKFNVCHCTNRYACEWFLSQGFHDWDDMGEELGKYLFE